MEIPATMCTNIIVAGGGRVVHNRLEIERPDKDIMVCSLIGSTAVDECAYAWWEAAKKSNIPVLECQLIIDFVTKEQIPSPPDWTTYIAHPRAPRKRSVRKKK